MTKKVKCFNNNSTMKSYRMMGMYPYSPSKRMRCNDENLEADEADGVADEVADADANADAEADADADSLQMFSSRGLC